jgi:HEAT repeat protein
MTQIRCPHCGAAGTEASRDDRFICPSCGKAVEPPPRQQVVPPPIAASENRDNRRWSDGPPEASANRWSMVAPLGDEESSASISVSQSSILPPHAEIPTDEPSPVRPARSPLVWPLAGLAVFLAILIAVVFVARRVKPWLDARRAAARRASVDYWIPRLENGPDEARREAAGALIGLGPAAVMQALQHISKDPGGGERFLFITAAIHALAAAGADATEGLCQGLRSPEARVRAAAANVVQELGRAGRGTREALIAALDDDNRWVRYYAIDALGSMGSDAAPAAKRLAKTAASRDAFAQRHALDALGHIGPAARDVLPALETIATEDLDPLVRDYAARAARQIDVQRLAGKARHQASGRMKSLLTDVLGPDKAAAIAAASELGNMGIAAQPAAAGLAAMLHHDDPARRMAAATALGKFGLGAIDFLPSLESAAGDDDPGVRAAAAKALEFVDGRPK